MTYAEKFKAKVAEVIGGFISGELHGLITDDMASSEIINTAIETDRYLGGIAEAICAVIDYEELMQVS